MYAVKLHPGGRSRREVADALLADHLLDDLDTGVEEVVDELREAIKSAETGAAMEESGRTS